MLSKIKGFYLNIFFVFILFGLLCFRKCYFSKDVAFIDSSNKLSLLNFFSSPVQVRLDRPVENVAHELLTRGELVTNLAVEGHLLQNVKFTLGGGISKENFLESGKMDEATVHFQLPNNNGVYNEMRISFLGKDPSLKREYLANRLFLNFYEYMGQSQYLRFHFSDSHFHALIKEHVNNDFLRSKKLSEVFYSADEELVHYALSIHSEEDIVDSFEKVHLFKFVLLSYLVNDTDGPFSQVPQTKNANILKIKFNNKYLFIPNDLDEVFTCEDGQSANEEKLQRILYLIINKTHDKSTQSLFKKILHDFDDDLYRQNFLVEEYEKIDKYFAKHTHYLKDPAFILANQELKRDLQCRLTKFKSLLEKVPGTF